jgi:hypothetical protein
LHDYNSSSNSTKCDRVIIQALIKFEGCLLPCSSGSFVFLAAV